MEPQPRWCNSHHYQCLVLPLKHPTEADYHALQVLSEKPRDMFECINWPSDDILVPEHPQGPSGAVHPHALARISLRALQHYGISPTAWCMRWPNRAL